MMLMAIIGVLAWAGLIAGACCISYWVAEAILDTIEDLFFTKEWFE